MAKQQAAMTVALAMSHGEAEEFETKHMGSMMVEFRTLDEIHEVVSSPSPRMRGYQVLWLRGKGVHIYIIVREIRSRMLQYMKTHVHEYPNYPPPAPPRFNLITLRYHIPPPTIMLPEYGTFCTKCFQLDHMETDGCEDLLREG